MSRAIGPETFPTFPDIQLLFDWRTDIITTFIQHGAWRDDYEKMHHHGDDGLRRPLGSDSGDRRRVAASCLRFVAAIVCDRCQGRNGPVIHRLAAGSHQGASARLAYA